MIEWPCCHSEVDRCVLEKRLSAHFMIFVSKIIDFAHATGKKVILEGVETLEDLSFAKKLNVDFVQGFYFKGQFKND